MSGVATAKLHVTLTLDGFGSVAYTQEGIGLDMFTDMVLALREITAGRIKIQGTGLFLMERGEDGRFKVVN